MSIKTSTVADPVDEILFKIVFLQIVMSNSIDIAGPYAGTDKLKGCALGLADMLIYIYIAVGWFSDVDGTSDI